MANRRVVPCPKPRPVHVVCLQLSLWFEPIASVVSTDCMHTPGYCMNPRVRWCSSRDSMVVWALINSFPHLAPRFRPNPWSSSILCLWGFPRCCCSVLLTFPEKLRTDRRSPRPEDNWPFTPKTVTSTKNTNKSTRHIRFAFIGVWPEWVVSTWLIT